jgi:hypothetical protein
MDYDTTSPEWDEAMEYARQRANEEGDVDLDYDEDLIFAWAEEYYDYLTNQKG